MHTNLSIPPFKIQKKMLNIMCLLKMPHRRYRIRITLNSIAKKTNWRSRELRSYALHVKKKGIFATCKKNPANGLITRIIPYSGRTAVFDIFYLAASDSANGELRSEHLRTWTIPPNFLIHRPCYGIWHCVSGRNATLAACFVSRAVRHDASCVSCRATLPRLVSRVRDSDAATSHLVLPSLV